MMLRSVVVGVIPYVVMLAGVPFFNKSGNVGGIPLLALWIGIWVVVTPAFLALAGRLLPRAEREDGQ
jgi:Kef-type K+ transport system membrane component KefB